MIEHEDIVDDEFERLESKRQLKKLLLAKTELMASDPLRFYHPHAKQDLFHRQGGLKHRAVFAGNRFGKSQMGVAEDAAFVTGCRPWYGSTDPAYLGGIPQRPVKLLIITTDWDKVDEIFTSERGELGKLWKMLPRGIVKTKKRNHSGAIEMMELNNGSVIRFDTVKSFEVNPQGSESSDWDAIHIDEPCSEDQYKAASRGLMDRGGCDWFTLTPLREPWIYDFFFSREDMEADKLANGLMSGGNRWAIRGSTYDNTFLSKSAIEDYESTLSEDEKTCRLLGVPLELSGMVYKEFSYSKHVYKECPIGWEDLHLPPSNWPVWVLIDPHPQTPTMCLFVAAAPSGQLFYFDEIFQKLMINELSEELLLRTRRFNSVRFVCDPLAFIEHPISGGSMAQEFARCGVPVRKATKALTQGIMRVKEELKKPDRLWFSCRLRETLFEFTHYVWDTRENKPKDKDDHAMECLYRSILEQPRFFNTVVSSPIIPELEIRGSRQLLMTI